MRANNAVLSSAIIALATMAGAAHAAGELKQVGTIAMPADKPLTGFDISFVDEKTQRVYLSDRGNAALDVFDGRTDKFIGMVPGFVGAKEVNGKVDPGVSGPAGVLVYDGVAWVGDGDSSAKEVNLKEMKIAHVVSTGGKARFDEIAYDPKDHVLAGGNGDDDVPFASFISTTQYKVIAKVPFPHNTDGLEQPAYDSATGMFYFSIPEIDKVYTNGGVAVLTPQGKLVKTLPVSGCHPNGIAFGPDQNFLLGCSSKGKEAPAEFVVMNAKSGKVVATIPDAGGADEVTYNSKNHQYYTGSAGMGALFVIDARTNKLVQKIETGGRAHSITTSDVTGKVFLPEGNFAGGCGCIRVFAPSM